MTKQRRTFTPEFKREAACLVLDQGYSHTEAAQSLTVPRLHPHVICTSTPWTRYCSVAKRNAGSNDALNIAPWLSTSSR